MCHNQQNNAMWKLDPLSCAMSHNLDDFFNILNGRYSPKFMNFKSQLGKNLRVYKSSATNDEEDGRNVAVYYTIFRQGSQDRNERKEYCSFTIELWSTEVHEVVL